ncbi:hypothetical protein HNQ53_003248 [Microbulbifer hydrolyticus]|uniref:Uncharacterized protein n=1 Tax=Microbulbifer hydrolyticus TaxID=48074 RepID=A0AA89PYF8_9GAMM|nr:hypothetical protein [Microbulbifer hydrolyticus]
MCSEKVVTTVVTAVVLKALSAKVEACEAG